MQVHLPHHHSSFHTVTRHCILNDIRLDSPERRAELYHRAYLYT